MKKIRVINSCILHILAMTFMLCDHIWATVVPGNMWLTNIGRMAFPIFAFMLVEGFFHTGNLKKYILRLLIGAILSEIPFNLMYGGAVIYPYHQSVMCTFLIAILCITLTEFVMKKNKIAGYMVGVLSFAAGTILGFVLMVDYYGFGILTVAVFYFFRGNRWWKILLQIAGLYIINVTLLGGMVIDINIGTASFEVVQQGFALLSFIPILLYNGEQGYHSKPFQYGCYLFYPVHMLILSIVSLYIL